MKKIEMKCLTVCWMLFCTLIILGTPIIAMSASISGTVRDSTGTAITGSEINVDVISGDPCGENQHVQGTCTDTANGTYTVAGLPAGNYYLIANPMDQSNYTHEWWSSIGSTCECEGAESLTVTAGNELTGIEFQLDLGGSISGRVTDQGGSPIVDMHVYVQSEGCGGDWLGGNNTDSNGDYTITGIRVGDVYVHTCSSCSGLNYIDESYDNKKDCNQADPVTVTQDTDTPDIDFQLDLGGSISGTVRDSTGTAITGSEINVDVISGDPCGENQHVQGTCTDTANGTYTVAGLPAGTYYLRTWHNETNYVDEWWSSEGSTCACEDAESLTVTAGGELTDIDFQLDLGGSISGTVRDSTGTAITGSEIDVQVISGDPCGENQHVQGTRTDTANGTYTVAGLPAGTYYLRTGNNETNYVDEWWSSVGSTCACEDAESLTVTAGDELTGIDFQLDLGGSISGRVTDQDGSPIVDMHVYVKSEGCGGDWLGGNNTDSNGDYTIRGIRVGDVYVQTCSSCSDLNYIDKLYNNRTDCNQADPVTVVSGQNTSGIDFYLATGPKRLGWYDMGVYNGDLNPGFNVQPGFRNELVRATLSIPNTSRSEYPTYTFDLVNDRFDLWDSECRFIDMWSHDFGPVEAGDYGDYTLTLVFSCGAQETYSMTLEEGAVTPVDETSIIVTVNVDGSVNMSWDLLTNDHQYYQVRVRNIGDGKEIYKGRKSLDMNETDISAYDLRCLEIGVNYRWLVRAFDEHAPFTETRETTAEYSPEALEDRIRWTRVMSKMGALSLGFDVRPGSRDYIKAASVTGPASFSYTFNLDSDWVDISTETRLSAKGWWHRDPGWPLADGDYTFTIEYDDDLNTTTDYTEIVTETLSVDSVTAVDSAEMQADIHEDGAITFSWDLPTGVTGQNYLVRIRSADGSKEYYSSHGLYDETEITASFYDLRGMERGQAYQWFVQAFSHDWDTMEKSSASLTYFIQRSAEIIGTWSNGIWYWDVAASSWTEMYSRTTRRDIAAGDFTGDGMADVASIWSSGLWYQDSATLGWTKVWKTAPNRIAAADITGDGVDEIIGCGGAWGSSGVYYRDVASGIWHHPWGNTPTGAIAAGDVTGDGKADMISCWSSGLWYQDGGTNSWTKVYSKAPYKVTAGDVTGDGQAEIIGPWSNGIWYWDVAESKWTRMTSYTTKRDIAAGDFTGDGKADVASCWSSGLWYQNGVTLGWTKVWKTAPYTVTAGDVTED